MWGSGPQCWAETVQNQWKQRFPFFVSQSGDLRDQDWVEHLGRVTTPICTLGREGAIFLILRREKQQRFAQLKDIISWQEFWESQVLFQQILCSWIWKMIEESQDHLKRTNYNNFTFELTLSGRQRWKHPYHFNIFRSIWWRRGNGHIFSI